MDQDANANLIKYFLYCRKSSEDKDRQILSIDSQLQVLNEIARKDKLEIKERFTESKSAKGPGRPCFNEMLTRIEKGEASGILCWKLDRLARNPVDEGRIKWLLQREIIQRIRTPDRDYAPNDNVLITSVEFGMANQYIRDLSKNVKRGMTTKLELGWYPNYAPLGYLNTKINQRGANQIVKDNERFYLVRRIWDLMLTGNYTPTRVLSIATDEWKLRTRSRRNPGGFRMCKSNIYKLLTNPFYYGWFEFPKGSGLWYRGEHEPMITKSEYDRVQDILCRASKPHPQRHSFAFTGLIRCGTCGASITAEDKIKQQQNGNVHRYVYYRCTKRKDVDCPERAVSLRNLDTQIKHILEGVTISGRFKDWAISVLHDVRKRESTTHNAILASRHMELERIVQLLSNLSGKFLSPENKDGGLYSNEEYRTLKNQLLRDKALLESELQNHSRAIEEWIELTEHTFNFARYALAWFNNGDTDTKRAILACLGSNLVLSNRQLRLELRKPFGVISKDRSGVEREIIQVRTSQNIDQKQAPGDILAKCPSLCAVVDDVRTSFEIMGHQFFIPKLSEDRIDISNV
jgi:site-specific DNA recombinase